MGGGLFIASYFRQLSADIKMKKKYETKTGFVRPERLKIRANKTGINFMILILIFLGNGL